MKLDTIILDSSHEIIVQGEAEERNEAYKNTSNEHRKDSTMQYYSSNGRVGGSADKQAIAMRRFQ